MLRLFRQDYFRNFLAGFATVAVPMVGFGHMFQ